MRAGSAQRIITPPVGLELAGWSFGPSAGIHNDLEARALAIEGDEGGLFVLITADGATSPIPSSAY